MVTSAGDLSRLLVNARKAQGMTQTTLAQCVGVSRKTISEMEGGLIEKVSVRTVLNALRTVGLGIEVKAQAGTPPACTQEPHTEPIDENDGPRTLAVAASCTQLSRRELAEILGIYDPELDVDYPDVPIDEQHRRTLKRLICLLACGSHVFGSVRAMHAWMMSEEPALEGMKPATLLRTAEGLPKLLHLIWKIDHGVCG